MYDSKHGIVAAKFPLHQKVVYNKDTDRQQIGIVVAIKFNRRKQVIYKISLTNAPGYIWAHEEHLLQGYPL